MIKDDHIRPPEYIKTMSNEGCNKAVIRFAERLNMAKIEDMIQEIPEQALGLSVMSSIQKEFNVTLLETVYETKLGSVAEKLLGEEPGDGIKPNRSH